MTLTITFCRETVKTLNLHLHAAFRAGNLPLIKHISALLMLADPCCQHLPETPPGTPTRRLGYSTCGC